MRIPGGLIFVATAMLRRGSTFLLSLAIATAVPVSTYGQIFTLTAISGLLSAVLSFGMDGVFFRNAFVHQDPQEERRYTSTLTLFLIVGAIGGAIVLATPFWFIPTFLEMPGWATAVIIIASGVTTAATIGPLALLRAKDRLRLFVIISLSQVVVMVTLRWVFVATLGWGAPGWAAADAISAVVLMALTAPLQIKALRGHAFSLPALRDCLAIGLNLVPHQVSTWILNMSDRIILVAILGTVASGQYSLSSQVGQIVLIVVTELNRGFLPSYGRLARNGGASAAAFTSHANLERRLTQLVVLAVGLYGPLLIMWFYSADYQPAAAWVPVLAVAYGLYGFYYVPMNYASIVEGRTRLVPLVTTTAAGVNIVLNLLFVGMFGPVVAAVTTVIGYAVLWLGIELYARTMSRAHELRWQGSTILLTAMVVAACTAMSVVVTMPTIAISCVVAAGTLIGAAWALYTLLALRRARQSQPDVVR